MAYDPVLERDMFRPKSKGVVSLDDTKEEEISDDLRNRREQALAMIEAAKQKFDPENYQTLTEQARPGVFRPVAVNMPAQQQTANTAQRMQQMAAQGVRPVAMADGGSVDNFMDAPDTISPTISSDPTSAGRIQALASRIRGIGSMPGPSSNLGVAAPEEAARVDQGEVSGLNAKSVQSPSTWSDEDIKNLADYIYNSKKEQFESSVAKTPAGRGIQSLDFTRYVPDKKSIVEDLKAQREMSQRAGESGAVTEEARRREAIVENPVSSVFSEVSPSDYAAQQERQRTALRKAEEPLTGQFPARPESVGTNAFRSDFPARPEGIGTNDFPARPEAAASQPSRDTGVASLADMEKSIASGRDAYGAEAPLAVNQEPKGIASLPENVRMGNEPGAAADAARKAAPPVAAQGGAPSTGGAQPAQGGLGSFKAAGESSDLGPMSIEGIRAERAREREENFNLALIQAGLAIMGGKSSNALANIGEGGMQGVRQFAATEAESKKNMREQQRAAQQEKLTRDEMALRERLSGAEIKSRADLAEEERKSRRSMFDITEQRLDTQMRMDWNKTEAAQGIAREELKIKQDLADNTISSAEADRKLKDSQFNKQIAFDEWKVKQGLAAPSDTMKLYEAIGGGDLNKGLKIVQDASTMDSKVRAAQDVLNPMSGASEDDKTAALNYLKSVIKVPSASTTGSRIIGVK